MNGFVVIDFDYRSDGGQKLVGPFEDAEAARTWVSRQVDAGVFHEASWYARRVADPDAS